MKQTARKILIRGRRYRFVMDMKGRYRFQHHTLTDGWYNLDDVEDHLQFRRDIAGCQEDLGAILWRNPQ